MRDSEVCILSNLIICVLNCRLLAEALPTFPTSTLFSRLPTCSFARGNLVIGQPEAEAVDADPGIAVDTAGS